MFATLVDSSLMLDSIHCISLMQWFRKREQLLHETKNISGVSPVILPGDSGHIENTPCPSSPNLLLTRVIKKMLTIIDYYILSFLVSMLILKVHAPFSCCKTCNVKKQNKNKPKHARACRGTWVTQQSISHLNWKCCESNLWPSPSSSVGFLARYKK